MYLENDFFLNKNFYVLVRIMSQHSLLQFIEFFLSYLTAQY